LSVVHGIVTSYNGHISVYSEPGRGTTFHVYLPTLEEDKNNTLVAEHLAERPAVTTTKKRHILCVDDEVAIGKMLHKMLRELGHEATVLSDSEETLALFREHPDTYDLLITDMTMPRMTGAQLAQKILAIRPEFPIILCTGFSEIIDEQAAQQIGIRKLVSKPLLYNDLAQLLAKFLPS
ncbi:MAG TPA: response regulator, partial [Desulfurivibrionaceae bacterium]|nr:response regulator [Desulfurivibrionaceae bacterium]